MCDLLFLSFLSFGVHLNTLEFYFLVLKAPWPFTNMELIRTTVSMVQTFLNNGSVLLSCIQLFSRFFPPGLSFLMLNPILYLHYKGHHTSLYIIFILFAKFFEFLFLSFGVSPNLSIKYKSDRHILDSFFQVIFKDIKSSDLKPSPIT